MASTPTRFDLTGRSVLITGANRGLGAALCKTILQYSPKIIHAGYRTTAGNFEDSRVNWCQLDIQDEESVAATAASFDELDVLINNAGMQHRTELHNFPPDAFERLLQTNIASVFHVGQAVARHMIARKGGKIINIASVQTALARPGIAPYTATKGAVGNLTKGMATDWAQYGLNCNAIAPGYFDTPLNAALVADSDFSTWLAKRTPAGRWGTVEELVGAAVFLSSDAASFVNGHILYVDGGITASL